MDLLSKILRVRGLTMRSVEKAAGMGENSLARLLQGKKNAYLSHVFRVLAALDIEPGEFFRLAYPQRPVRSTDELLDPRLVRVAAGGSLDEETESAPGPGERAAGKSRL
jgi:transcriptional regulator with XRE-family HTH domain